MRFQQRPEGRQRWTIGVAIGILSWLTPVTLSAQVGVGGRVIADAELWTTDSASRLLARDSGRFAPLLRLQLFATGQLSTHWELHALGELETGKATDDGHTDVSVEQIDLRYIRSPALIVAGGRFIHPVGTFGGRRFSTVNPLIGEPDAYPDIYPWGARVEGTVSQFDYRLALVTLPVSHPGYVPDPDARLRTAIGAGYSPMEGTRIGISATAGSYLNRSLQDSLPAGKTWTDYRQRLLAVDLRFSHGYFESHAELALSGYDAPTRTASVNGLSYYLEGKYTWSPRIFTALRLEANNYAFVQPVGGGAWFARSVQMLNGEVGAGYRFSADVLLKASYRRDRWPPDLAAFLPNGHALAVQLSYQAALEP
jgi:hypothetical protein